MPVALTGAELAAKVAELDAWLLPCEAAELLRVDPKAFNRWRRSGWLPEQEVFYTPGGHLRISAAFVRRVREHRDRDLPVSRMQGERAGL
jgi:hypothetical protein